MELGLCFICNSGSQLGVFLPSWGYLAMSEDILGCYCQCGEGTPGIQWVEAGKHPKTHRRAPRSTDGFSPNASSAAITPVVCVLGVHMHVCVCT